MTNNDANIYAKLLAVRQSIGTLAKTGSHGQGWKYFAGDAVLQQVGDALAEHGVVFIPQQVNATLEDGTALIEFDMLFVDAETGSTLTVKTYGSAKDTQGKEIYKAQTLTIKYLFLRMFLVGEGEGDEEAPSQPRKQRQPQQRRTKLATPAAQPSKGDADAQPPDAGNQDDGTFTGPMLLAYKNELIAAKIAKHTNHAQNIVFEAMRKAHKITEFTDIFKHTDAEVRAAVDDNRENQPDAEGA